MSVPDLACANVLLAALPRSHRQLLLARLERVSLPFREVLYEPGKTIAFVYFPVSAVVSLLTLIEGRLALEVGMIGREGLLGIPLALGSHKSSGEAVVQGAGEALRMRAAPFLRALQESLPLRRQVYAFANAQMFQISQTAACNRFHPVDARLARWLLMTRDRVGNAEFALTHQFLANMLGTRREGVTQAANRLQRRGLIEYGRGHLHILNERGLEAIACSCYRVLRVGRAGRTSA